MNNPNDSNLFVILNNFWWKFAYDVLEPITTAIPSCFSWPLRAISPLQAAPGPHSRANPPYTLFSSFSSIHTRLPLSSTLRLHPYRHPRTANSRLIKRAYDYNIAHLLRK